MTHPVKPYHRWAWTTRVTADGRSYTFYGDPDEVPGIPKMWLDGVVFLYASEDDARAGVEFGGTGFLMCVDPSPGLNPAEPHVYVVTNAHVIEMGFTVVRGTGSDGRIRTVPLATAWVPHPDGDDVALAAVEMTDEFRRTYVPFEMAVTPELFENEELSPGDEAFFIGRFVFRDGRSANTPTVRFGSIAQVGGDPILQKDRPSGRRFQESFLVECHSLSGFSGSPVFAYRGARLKGGDDANSVVLAPMVGNRVYLLGIDWGSDPWTAPVLDSATDAPVQPGEYVKASSGMAAVVPAWKIRGVLDEDKLRDAREEREREMRMKDLEKGEGAANMDSARQQESEFDRFKELTRELVNTPKPKPDEDDSSVS
jgi:Trypsin-like peptidase domain